MMMMTTILSYIDDVDDYYTIAGTKLKVYPSESKESSKGIAAHQKMYFVIQALKAALPHVIVQGIPTVSRAVINEESSKSGTLRDLSPAYDSIN